jgi:pilus assembly protein CpaE
MRLLVAQSQQLGPSQGGTTAEDKGEQPHGKVIAAFSPKGGVGTTTLAVNLACALTTFGRRVVVVDGNVCFGNAGMFLNIAPGRNMLHVVDDPGGIQDANVDEALHAHPSGLKVMLSPDKAEDGDTIRGEHLRTIIANLQARYDYVVVDTWPSYDERVLAVLEMADHVLVPTAPELPSIRNLAAFLRVADLLKYPEEKLIPILIRSDSVSATHREGLEDFLLQPLTWQIVSDGRRVTKSVNEGEPFVLTDPDASVSQNVYTLARALDGQVEDLSAPVERSRSFWKQPRLAFAKSWDWPLSSRTDGDALQIPGR